MNDHFGCLLCRTPNGISKFGISIIPKEKLIDSGLYFDRPPYELVFLSNGEHQRIHSICRDPRVREGLRRLEMQRWYARCYPIDNLLLDSYECNKLNKELEDESEDELREINNKL